MPTLEVAYPDGRRESLPLSRTAPLTIGAQSFNDLCIADEDVAAMHCRIGWNKTGYEVTAATSKGVDVNSTIIEHAFLKPGDIVRVGRCDLVYASDESAAPVSRKGQAAVTRAKEPRAAAKPAADEPVPGPDTNDLSVFEGPIQAESLAAILATDVEEAQESFAEAPEKQRSAAPAAPTGVVGKFGRELQGGRRRPGEQEILKSPLILALGGGSVLLLLIAGTLWLLLGRETSARLYQQAEQDLAQAKYAQAIEQFEEYVRRYPGSARALPARISAGKARVQKELTGSTPAWSLAWDRLQGFVREFRNTETYGELQPAVRQFAEEIAVGAAQTAEQTKDATLLPISAEATLLLERTAGEDVPIGVVLERIKLATGRAEAAIAKQNVRDAAVAAMQKGLAAQQPIDALAEREALLRKFPDYGRDRGISELLQQALAMEAATVTVDDADRPAVTEDSAVPPHHVLPVFHSRSRTSDASLGQLVWGLAQDSCYALDTMTGEPVWRRVIGQSAAFAPVTVRGKSALGWLMFDSRTSELLHCRADTGVLLWRQALSAVPSGAPIVDEGQLYLVTANRELLRIDVETGAISAKVTFSQPIIGPPTLDATRQFLFVTGHRGLIYALRKRPLECVSVTFTDHAAGAVRVPLVTVGRLLLLTENDRSSSARLRLWDAANPVQPLRMELEQRTEGLVYDAPVLRGAHLVVPLQGERVTAYVVNDAEGHSELTPVGTYRVQDGYSGPLHVMLGPDQQFWMSSTAFRRFEIAADSLRMDPNFVAVGLTAQPLQAASESFFVGRRARYAEAVQLTNVDRQSLTGTWRTVLGARPRAVAAGAGGNLVLVTESGFVTNIGAARLQAGGIERTATTDLDWPLTLTEPPLIGTLADGRGAVAIGGDSPRLWLIESTGRISAPVALPAALEQPPLLMAAGLILPLDKRLKLQPNAGIAAVEDWRAPVEGDASARWTQLLRTADDAFLAFDALGRCRRMEIRQGEIPHIAEIAVVNLPAPLATTPLLVGESVVVASHDHQLRQLDLRTLEPTAEWNAEHPILKIAAIDAQVLVWDTEHIRLLAPERGYAEIWSIPAQGRLPAGAPLLREETIWAACANGDILVINRNTGVITPYPALPQALATGPVVQGDAIWVAACDGTLYRLDPPAERQP